MIQVNAMGDACPIPVVKTRQALQTLGGPGQVETLVDNETAVSNLLKLAASLGCTAVSKQLGEGQYQVCITSAGQQAATEETPPIVCESCARPNLVAVISSEKMGGGDDALGQALMKAFLYALSQQEQLPRTILLYNGGAKLACTGSPALEDLQAMARDGVEIFTCGTCLNHYGLKEQLAVGEVTNMYAIVEKMAAADRILRP